MLRLQNIAGNLGRAIALSCVLALASASATGQSTEKIFPPLLVAKLKSAKTISLAPVKSRGWADGDSFERQIIRTVATWRLYQLGAYSAGADLVFEPSVEAGAVGIAVRDPRTQSVLWMFRREFNDTLEAIPAVLDDIRRAAGQPLSETAPNGAPTWTQSSGRPKVFISTLTGRGDDQAYNRFYGALNASGRFELVATPVQADLIFETSFADAVHAAFRQCENAAYTRYENGAFTRCEESNKTKYEVTTPNIPSLS